MIREDSDQETIPQPIVESPMDPWKKAGAFVIVYQYFVVVIDQICYLFVGNLGLSKGFHYYLDL